MLKKLAVSLGVFAMVLGLFGSEAYAVTWYGPKWWRTEDGLYELTLSTTSAEPDVWVEVHNVVRIPYSGGVPTAVYDLSPLSVRLCNASSGNCTVFKKFSSIDGHALFTNMKPGTYYVDIVDSWPSYYFQGDIKAARYNLN
jgi:hypothetical protein